MSSCVAEAHAVVGVKQVSHGSRGVRGFISFNQPLPFSRLYATSFSAGQDDQLFRKGNDSGKKHSGKTESGTERKKFSEELSPAQLRPLLQATQQSLRRETELGGRATNAAVRLRQRLLDQTVFLRVNR